MPVSDVYSRTALLADADRCVLCGLCSAQCPTYGLYQTETEAPRGRIAMIQGVLRGQIQDDAAIDAHLNHCLGCRRCEAQCPSGVPYGRLIDGVKMHFDQRRPPVRTGISALSRSNALRRVARALARALPTALLPHWGRILKAYQRPIPTATKRHSGSGTVALFSGCITDMADQMAVHAARHLLTALGLTVNHPPSSTCCGALALHAGDRANWENAAKINGNAYADEMPVLSLTPGCTAALLEYRHIHDAQARSLAARVQDVGAYIANHPRWQQLRFDSRPLRVGIHLPCTQRNVLKDTQSTRALLKHIPQMTLIDLPDLPACCGAAGTKMLELPTQAQTLRAPLLDFVREQQLDCVVSTNIGCALHLLDGLRRDNITTKIMHPLTLAFEALAPEARA